MSKTESANLILKLYELRREEKMREARHWMASFFPESAEDIMKVMIDSKDSVYYRTVLSYWEMAASFVNHGTIDEEMFSDAHSEHIVAFSKIEPFLAELRTMLANPTYLRNLEKLIVKSPADREMLADRRERIKRLLKARTENVKGWQMDGGS